MVRVLRPELIPCDKKTAFSEARFKKIKSNCLFWFATLICKSVKLTLSEPDMPQTIYCWRCQKELPMLTDDEWKEVAPLLVTAINQIKAYRALHQCSLLEASAERFGDEALAAYERITGFKETNPNALFHHRLSIYGPPCHACGKPLRTPQARHCAMCSAEHIREEHFGV